MRFFSGKFFFCIFKKFFDKKKNIEKFFCKKIFFENFLEIFFGKSWKKNSQPFSQKNFACWIISPYGSIFWGTWAIKKKFWDFSQSSQENKFCQGFWKFFWQYLKWWKKIVNPCLASSKDWKIYFEAEFWKKNLGFFLKSEKKNLEKIGK